MQLNVKKYLLDISTSIDSITEYIGNDRDFLFYDSNKLLRRAVERELEIIGEAVNRILRIDSEIDISNGNALGHNLRLQGV